MESELESEPIFSDQSRSRGLLKFVDSAALIRTLHYDIEAVLLHQLVFP